MKQRMLPVFLSFAIALSLILPSQSAYAQGYSGVTGRVLYEEDFGSCELVPGETSGDWYFYRSAGSNAAAEIKDGALYFYGTTNTESGSYDSLRLNVAGADEWTDYTVEADITYLKDSGWFGLSYNVSGNTTYQKGTIPLRGNASLNGLVSNTWVNNEAGTNRVACTSYPVPGETFRLKVVNDGAGTSSMYYAFYAGDILGEYTQLMEVTNIDSQTTAGTVGFMMGAKANATSIKVDNIKVTQNADNAILYEDDFNHIAGEVDVTLVAGETVSGWHFYRSADSNATAEMKDGALYFKGTTNTASGSYDSLRLEADGSNLWTNYTVEADITYLRDSGWFGLCYNAASDTTYQKGTVPMSGNASLNGLINNEWVNNVSGMNRVSCESYPVQGETFRIKIVNDGANTSSLHYATYNNDILGDYTQIMEVSNIDARTVSGTIGFMLGARANATDIKVDNILVYENIEVDPYIGGIAEIYVPETGIVNPPVVIQKVTTASSYGNLRVSRPAVAIMDIDANLNIRANGITVDTVSGFVETFGGGIIPAFVIDSSAEATSLGSYLKNAGIIDAYVVADSANASLVKAVRNVCPEVRGALIFDSLETVASRKAAFSLVNQSLGYIAISRTELSEETVSYFNTRVMPVWGHVEDTADVYTAISNGYGGMITHDAGMVYDVYSSITETTVSGRPQPIGHRGHSDYPEMTISSFHGAINSGAKAVEIDLRLSKDGEIVIMHDDTVTRTTNGLGTVASHTLAELKELYVGELTDQTDRIPTLEEIFIEFQDTDLVFYCEMKVKNDTLMNRFNELVQQYGYEDRAIVFISYSARSAYNDTNMTPGLAYTAATTDEQLSLESDQDCIEAFIKQLAPYNYQTLYYNFNGHATEPFYYSLAARGFAATHSTTNGRAKLNNTLITGLGAIGVLTDHLPLCEGYFYQINVEDTSIGLGEALPLDQVALKIKGSELVTCGFVQLSGPSLIWSDSADGYTLETTGTVSLAYYADVTANGANYRIYSPAVTITYTE